MVALYGPDNGFGWHLNETVGAQIVSVPVAVPRRLANAAFTGWLGSVAFLGLATLVVVGLALLSLVTRRIGRITAAADEIAAGNLSAQDLPVEGTDEVASLERAFNRMRESLAGARRR
jgi:protein-histidine pros-kinase